jgi:hypothetical protein
MIAKTNMILAFFRLDWPCTIYSAMFFLLASIMKETEPHFLQNQAASWIRFFRCGLGLETI